MCRTCLCSVPAHFRKMRGTTRRARSRHSPSGQPRPSAINISRIRGSWSMRKLKTSATRLGSALAAATTLIAPLPLQGGLSDPQAFAQIERGRYLAVLSDCTSCHTVPGSSQPFARGRAIETPFGNILAPNITPDRETGIGAWSDDDFDAAVRKGVRPNGARLYPAMPYNAFTKMSRNDVLAIRAYLNTVAPVRNAVVADALPFPFSVRAVMGVWDTLYFTAGEYKPDPNKSAEWNRGAYIVTGPAHCPACHTPKTFLVATRRTTTSWARTCKDG